ncbi:10331_t:CDS:2, partial [Funneliformis mosseae]
MSNNIEFNLRNLFQWLVQPPGQLIKKNFLNYFLNEKPEVKIPLCPANFSQIYIKGPGFGMNEDSFHAFWDGKKKAVDSDEPSKELTKKFKEWIYGECYWSFVTFVAL